MEKIHTALLGTSLYESLCFHCSVQEETLYAYSAVVVDLYHGVLHVVQSYEPGMWSELQTRNHESQRRRPQLAKACATAAENAQHKLHQTDVSKHIHLPHADDIVLFGLWTQSVFKGGSQARSH